MNTLQKAVSSLQKINWERFILRLIIAAVGCGMVGIGMFWEGGLVILIAIFGDRFAFRMKEFLTKALSETEHISYQNKDQEYLKRVEHQPHSLRNKESRDETV